MASCSDSLTYNRGTEPISLKILTQSDTILVGNLVEFKVEIKPSIAYAKRWYWILNSTKHDTRPLDITFTESGVYNAAFYIVDYLDDTLSTDTVTITVANTPVCNSIELECATKTFKWDCYDKDGEKLTYSLLYTEDGKNRTATPDTNFWKPTPSMTNNWRVKVTAANRFKFQTEISEEGEPCP